MTPAARLQATLDLLNEVATKPRPADALVGPYFRARRYIGSKDRAGVAALFYDLLRHQARLDWWIQRQKEEIGGRLRLVTYLAVKEGKTAAEIDRLFDGKKFSPEPLTVREHDYLKKLKGHTLFHPHMDEAVRAECPSWAYGSLKARFGDDCEKELNALLEPAPLDIRVNPLKADRETIRIELKKAGFKAEPCRYTEFGLRLYDRPSLTTLPMLREGRVEIQDEGSQLIAILADARPGQRVVDFCAGAGGKTLAMAATMKNKGRIIACDVLEGRLRRSTERFRRAGVHNIEIKPLESERDPWVKRHKADFDRVLIDAPCSGTGAWRRNPDTRWRSLGPGLEALLVIQSNILESAARLVKPGGRLIYATCSMLPEENERQVEHFLEKAGGRFTLKPFEAFWAEKEALKTEKSPCPSKGDYLSLTPYQTGTDGFFGAILENVAPPKPLDKE